MKPVHIITGILGTALPVSNGRQGPPNMKIGVVIFAFPSR